MLMLAIAGGRPVHADTLVLAQAGSVGGSIGKSDKSVSGSQDEPRATSRPGRARAPAPERRARSGGGGNFDGAWAVASVGTSCQGGSTNAVVVTSGRIIGQGINGQVGANGAVRANGNANGVTVVSVGRLSGRSGSGSFRQSDGCVGRWTASKQ